MDQVETLDLTEETERIFKVLNDCLPDAVPEYLRSLCDEFAWEPGKLTEFINVSIESQNYPKIIKKVDQIVPVLIKTYSIEEFVKKYNNPMDYFMKNSVGSLFFSDSSHFLRNRYRHLTVVDINKTFRLHKFNLFMTKLALAVKPRSRKTVRPYSAEEYETMEQSFYDEIFFLDHEETIIGYLEKIKKIKEKEEKIVLKRKQKAKEKGELLTCQCCFDDELFCEDVVQCTEGHIFCKECVKKSAEMKMSEGVYQFPCMTSENPCTGQLDFPTIKAVLSSEAFEKLCTKVQEAEVKMASVSGIYFCPFCEYGAIPADEDRIFKCQKCDKESCRECKQEAHIPYKCDEARERRGNASRIYVENQMTNALIRICWSCKRSFIKIDGCNKMQCVCGAKMCYVCKQPVNDYCHFGQGNRDEVNKCPLYSKNKELHFNEIKKAAKRAKLELKALNLQETESNYDFLKGLTEF